MGDICDRDLDGQIGNLEAILVQDGLEPLVILMVRDTIAALEEKRRVRISERRIR